MTASVNPMDDRNRDLNAAVRKQLRIHGVKMGSDAERAAIAVAHALRDHLLATASRSGTDVVPPVELAERIFQVPRSVLESTQPRIEDVLRAATLRPAQIGDRVRGYAGEHFGMIEGELVADPDVNSKGWSAIRADGQPTPYAALPNTVVVIQPASRPSDDASCPRCLGCGQLADSDDREPWTMWQDLPPGSDLAVRLGIVRPVPCGHCSGTGKKLTGEAGGAAEEADRG